MKTRKLKKRKTKRTRRRVPWSWKLPTTKLSILDTRLKKKMNCNPAVKDKTIDGDTCYTKEAITVLRDAYNKEHREQPILASEPKQIWKEMQSRFSGCSTEDCWLDQMKEAKIRKQMDKMLFAPDQPPEWKKKPNEWLSNFDIAAVLQQYEVSHPTFKMIGPTPIDYDVKEEDGHCVWDELCKLDMDELRASGKKHLGIVFNLDDHDGPGLHWTSMFVNMENALIYYYDSALYPFPKEVGKLKNEIIRQGKKMNPPIHFCFMRNRHTHQEQTSTCGMYCLFFIITFLTKETEFMKNMSQDQIIALFHKHKIPDKYVQKYREIYFNG
jgi:hypothetical protein